MKASYYYFSTVLLFVLEATCAILINDVTTVFDFLAAIAVTCLGFFFPAVFYIWAEKRFGLNSNQIPKNTLSYRRCMAYAHLLIGILAFLVCMFSNIYSIVKGSE